MAEVTATPLPPAPASDSAEAIQARKSSNLAATLFWLERRRRDAMNVFYDFCRIVDDIADDPDKPDADKAAGLNAWRQEIQACYSGRGEIRLAAELAPIIKEFDIREQDLLAIVDGVSMDIGNRRYETFEELREYCFGVASAVGLVSVRIFGCNHPNIDEYAETLGYALQFTNILRDVVEDYNDIGRVYLPQAELRAFGVTEADLAHPADNENCKRLFRMCHYRCKHFFNKARRLLPATERHNLKAALIMGAVYEDILDKIAARDFRLTKERVRLSKGRKIHLIWRTLKSINKPMPVRRAPGTALVWGGGIAGITSAVRLGYEGFTPTLLESKSYLGGRAHSLSDAPTGLTLDNGAHIVMGCYKAFLDLLDTLGISHKFERQNRLCVPYVGDGGKWSELAAKDVTAPLHLLAGLMNFSALTKNDRLAITALGAKMRLGAQPADQQTALEWLRDNGQTEGSMRALWEPFCVAALNEPLSTACAQLLYETIRRSLFGSVDDSAIYLAKVGLTEVFEPETELYLQAIGGGIRRKSQVKSVVAVDDMACAIETSKGDRISADIHICALPWTALRGLLPSGTAIKNRVSSIPSASILSIHILTNKEIFKHPTGFVGLLDSSIHWIFDRTNTLTPEHQGKHLYAIIVSAADGWMKLKSNEIMDKLQGELNRFFPDATDVKVERSLVYKSKDATFSARPTTAGNRPRTDEAPWDNVWLAGDWIQTGLPATIEGAALSGDMAVKAIDENVQPKITLAI
ncbi:hydroxysqualene dehydroxylase HpnE [Cerasicoccus fimbriatus]|uniref:hydroxysqualene dehydroxylase HpnE n=1 Tax=Cerasicoccus fimbriatus TaxID=3014554 RepID=UPI0022B3FC3C|nr:hydroxysqualene dehydroxylase HpnE [Cerasicoccus sp. TK19100]